MIKRTTYLPALLAAVFATAALQPGTAQTPPPPAAGVRPMSDELNLTDAQKVKIKARLDRMKPELDALNSNKTLTHDQKNVKFEALKAAYEADMQAILTPSQRKIFLMKRHSLKAKESQITDNMIAVAKLSKEIKTSLTAAQQKQIEQIQKDSNAQALPIYKDKTLADKDKVAKLTAIEKNTEVKVKAVMPPVTRAKFLKLLKMQDDGMRMMAEFRTMQR